MTGDVERSHVQGIIDQGFPVLLKPIQPAKFMGYAIALNSGLSGVSWFNC